MLHTFFFVNEVPEQACHITTMMTHKYLGRLLCAVLLVFIGCQKAPELTLTSSSNIEFSADGSSGSITFTANQDWTARANDSWVSVSPSSGAASDGAVTVTVRCNANTTYEDRSTTVTIKMGDLSQTVSVKQPANKGIVLPKQVFDLQSDTRSIDVEVQANVQYSVSTSANWIKQVGTKALSSKTLSFSIEENKTYDPREGKITIKPTEGNVQEQVITVRQAQKAAMNVEKTSYEMPYGGGEIEIKVESNVSFDVTPNVDWLHYTQTKALSSSTICIKVDENTTFSNREGKIEIAQKNGSLKHTITVKQAGRIAVTSVELNMASLQMREGDTETLVATVKPDNATDKTVTWSSSDVSIASVDASGKVTAIKEGSATITAKAGDKTASCSVIIENTPVIEAIDLGLSVKWATCNLGAEQPEDYGEYYAWGETETKSSYSWTTYKFGTNSSGPFSKYNTRISYGTVDDKIVLEPGDDVARVKLGGGWRIPTDAEWTELRTKCTWTRTTQNGVNGYKFTASNGNSIFLPAAGCRDDTDLRAAGSDGYYWSSSLATDIPSYARGVFFYPSDVSWYNFLRCYGQSVRPVTDGIIPVSSISLDKESLELSDGESKTLKATIKPDNATNKTVSWSSSNNAVATVDNNGKVTAIKEGATTITAKAGDKETTCSINVKKVTVPNGAVDLGVWVTLSDGSNYRVFWAKCNIGASKPEDYGDYYAWGETETKENRKYGWDYYKWGMSDWYYGDSKATITIEKYTADISKVDIHGFIVYCKAKADGKVILEPADDVAHVKLGGNWRMPTTEELLALKSQCTWTWTNKNGINGYEVTGSNKNSIFLPASGIANHGKVNEEGHYWTSSLDTSDPSAAHSMSFSQYDNPHNQRGDIYFAQRCLGFSIRPVTE